MDSKKAGYQEGLVSVIVNAGLFALKFWAGTVSGSVALIADAWHTLSDSVSSVIVIAGTRLSGKKADKRHPFGHGRWEQIAALFIAFLLGIIAYDIIRDSVQQFKAHESANYGVVAIVVTIFSILVKEGLAQYAFRLGKISGNTAVKADGWHHRSDALSSVAVLIGILVRNWAWWIDSLLGLIIALMLFYAVYEISKDAITRILGEQPSDDLIREIREIVATTSECDLEPHHFHIHNYVNHRELTFHIKVNRSKTIFDGHEIATRIEDEIRERLNIEATIHVEPTEKVCG